MKKILAILAVAFAGTAFAQGYGAVEYESAEDRTTGADSGSVGLIVGQKFGDYNVSGKFSTSQPSLGNGALTNRYEARVKRTFNAYGVKPYAGVRLGENVKSDTHFGYYAIDAGVVVPVASKVDVDVSYRYRDAFKSGNDFQTNRYGIEGIYKVTAKDSVGLRYARSYNDSESNSWRLQYTHSF